MPTLRGWGWDMAKSALWAAGTLVLLVGCGSGPVRAGRQAAPPPTPPLTVVGSGSGHPTDPLPTPLDPLPLPLPPHGTFTMDGGSGAAVDAGSSTFCKGEPVPACVFDGFDAGPACTPSPIPALPRVPLDGGIPGPCEVTNFVGWGTQTTPASRTLYTYDSAGRVVRALTVELDGGPVAQTVNHYDACGHLLGVESGNLTGASNSVFGAPFGVTEAYQFGDLGLEVMGQVTSSPGYTAWSYALDAGAHLIHGQDLTDCSTMADYLFDDAGRLATIIDYDPPTWGQLPAHTWSFSYGPAGQLTISRWHSSHGYWEEQDWDDAGYPVGASGTGGATSETWAHTWTYDGAHRLIAEHGWSQANGCAGDGWSSSTYAYDDAGLLRTEVDAHSGDACNAGHYGDPVPDQTDFTYPSPGVRVGTRHPLDGGAAHMERITFDARGNATLIEDADPPGFTWYPTERRGYDGCF